MNTDGMSIRSKFGLATAGNGLSNCEDKCTRFSFVMIVLNGMPFIEYSLESIYDFAHEIIIVEGAVENCMFAANADGGSTDGTVEFIESFPDPQGKIKLIRGRWPEKCEMQNEALKHVSGNYVWLIDSDEVYKKEHLERIKGILESDPSITQVNFIPDNFWKGLDYIFVSRKFWEESCHYRRLFKYVPGARFSTHRPPTMVWPGHNGTTEQMNLLDGTATREMGIVLYHYSYVLDEQVKQKVELYRRYGWDRHWKLDLEKWYRECFLKWTPENRQEIDSGYPIWTGDINSRTQVFTGTHPEVMRDFNREQSSRRASQRQAGRQSAQTPVVVCRTTPAWAVGQPPHLPTRVGAAGPRSETAIRNILWIRTDSIGDAVLSSSMLPHIRHKWKDARITVVCQEYVAELYEACPDVDDIVTFNKRQALQNEHYREEIIKPLRAMKPDLSLNSVYSREALTDWFALKCGAKRSVAHEGNLCNISRDIRDANNRLYTEVLPSGEEHKPELVRHEDFLRGLGVEATGLQPMVWIRPSDEEYAEQIFRDYRLDSEGTIALFAGAQYNCRVYEEYGEALAEFCCENRLEIVALGTAREQAINQKNLDAAGVRAVNLSGKTSVLESAVILKRCRLALGAETGLAHICCAVGTPNVILVGGGHFGRFMPYSPLTSVACLPLDCFGCNWNCRYKRPHCVKDVAPAAAGFQEFLAQNSRFYAGRVVVGSAGRAAWVENG